MHKDLLTVRAALDEYRRTGPAYAQYPAWKVALAKRLMDSIMFTGEGMVAYLCHDGSVLTINDLGLSAHEDDIVLALYDLFIEWGFPREMFFTPLHAVMDWLDCDEDEAIAVADQLDLEDLSLLTRRDYDDWVTYAAGHIPQAYDTPDEVVAEACLLRERRDAEAAENPSDDDENEIPF